MPNIFDTIDKYHTGLSPAKVARKYEFLTETPFRFFRGTSHLFYDDLSKACLPASPHCWICGDLHVENFGSYKGDNRLVYFDVNDFDESILAPVAWEIVRVVTSILVAFDGLTISDKDAIKYVNLFLNKYASTLFEGKPKYIETNTAQGIVKKFLQAVQKRSEEELFEKRTTVKRGKLKLDATHDKHLKIDKELKRHLIIALREWMSSNQQPPNNYKVLDANFRLAGTGSLGIKRYVFLIEKIVEPGKHLLIDMKQAKPSSLAPFVKVPQPLWASEAERMSSIQKVMQNVPPARLGTLIFREESYLMQEMQPTKDRINFKIIQDNFKHVSNVLEDMAMLAASAHLRTVGRKSSCTAEELIAFGQDTGWHKDILDYSVNYKNKVLSDYKSFKKQIKFRHDFKLINKTGTGKKRSN
ncbi:DUF2252 domain-containing protein [Ferruginibacter sp.]|uniref:DUF2252 domain-containing protein n=1 Tax=Ferruginibacter sp. TaxID=1940288 RepID=UPI002657F661|nr:DUF2252 family protein [Ferruginibacter sp.]